MTGVGHTWLAMHNTRYLCEVASLATSEKVVQHASVGLLLHQIRQVLRWLMLVQSFGSLCCQAIVDVTKDATVRVFNHLRESDEVLLLLFAVITAPHPFPIEIKPEVQRP